MNCTLSRSTSTSECRALSKKPSHGTKLGWCADTITALPLRSVGRGTRCDRFAARSQAHPDGLVGLGELRLHLQAADARHRLLELVGEVGPRHLELALVLQQGVPLAAEVALLE